MLGRQMMANHRRRHAWPSSATRDRSGSPMAPRCRPRIWQAARVQPDVPVHASRRSPDRRSPRPGHAKRTGRSTSAAPARRRPPVRVRHRASRTTSARLLRCPRHARSPDGPGAVLSPRKFAALRRDCSRPRQGRRRNATSLPSRSSGAARAIDAGSARRTPLIGGLRAKRADSVC